MIPSKHYPIVCQAAGDVAPAGPAGVTSLHASGLRACRSGAGPITWITRALGRALPAPIPREV